MRIIRFTEKKVNLGEGLGENKAIFYVGQRLDGKNDQEIM